MKSKSQLIFISFIFAIFLIYFFSTKIPSPQKTYEEEAKSLLKELSKENLNNNKVRKKSKELTQKGIYLLKIFNKTLPKCDKYFAAIKKAAHIIPNLKLDQIEKDYHADGALPENTNANCYHVKDLVVHPATVYAMAKNGLLKDLESFNSAKHEIEEVIAHFKIVKPLLKKKSSKQ